MALFDRRCRLLPMWGGRCAAAGHVCGLPAHWRIVVGAEWPVGWYGVGNNGEPDDPVHDPMCGWGRACPGAPWRPQP